MIPSLLALLSLAGCTSSWAPTDADSDGYTIADGDCYDASEGADGVDPATVNPGADETWYDGFDGNCSGDDDFDADSDGYVPTEWQGLVTQGVEGSGFLPSGDCWDSPDLSVDGASAAGLAAFDVNPAASDAWYDGVDADCGGDDDYDADLDGFATAALPDLSGLYGDDCNDADAAVNPSAAEVWYDGYDRNCDEWDDYDADMDGVQSDAFGGEDCDDDSADAFPGNEELWYDGIDGDCGGDNDYDVDADGYESSDFGGEDCDDFSDAANPDATEVWYDGVDLDCDGESDYDADGDGDDSDAHGGGDCDDSTSTTFSGAPDDWYDGVDADCAGDSDYDIDGDGYDSDSYGGDDCDDDRRGVNPGATETCSTTYDDDCDDDDNDDGATGCTTYYLDEDDDDWGVEDDSMCLCVTEGSYTTETPGDCMDSGSSYGVSAEFVNPDAGEECDQVDNDCDDLVDEDDPDLSGLRTWYYDADEDGYGDPDETMELCYQPTGYVSTRTDCDDGDPDINPSEDELCSTDGVDDNCDGEADEDSAVDADTWYADTDSDNYGDPAVATNSCDRPTGYVSLDTDCDDTDADVNPGEFELCSTSGVDDDCDGTADEDSAFDADDWYLDGDGDTYGDPDELHVSCDAPSGHVADDSDCDDSDSSQHPGATEVCNDEDDDCDSTTDEEDASGCTDYYYDSDDDGWTDDVSTSRCFCDPTGSWTTTVTSDEDCDDTDGAVAPDATERCSTSGVDDDCDGTADEEDASGCVEYYYDRDGDGWTASTSSSHCYCSTVGYWTTTVTSDTDCDDTDADIAPDAPELCSTSGVDDDCDGSTDEEDASGCVEYYYDRDGDGWTASTSTSHCYCSTVGYWTTTVTSDTDCNDTDADIAPDADERCATAGVDDDCDGTADEASAVDASTWYRDADSDGHGVATTTTDACDAPSGYTDSTDDCDDTDGDISPDGTEVCDGVNDEDCDDLVDDADPSVTGTTSWYVDSDDDGYGDETDTPTASCLAPTGTVDDHSDCNDVDVDINPGATEVCDGTVDEDCDDLVDDADPSVTGTTSWYADSDDDGYGSETGTPTAACVAPTGTVTDHTDCDDGDIAVNPAGTEVCDGTVDEDCDDLVDDADPGVTGTSAWYPDADGDGLGDSLDGGLDACEAPSGYLSDNSDCDDSCYSCRSGTASSPDGNGSGTDGEDDDCDGYIDEDTDWSGALVINEFMPAPNGGVEWIEVVNTSSGTIYLDGWEVSQGSTTPHSFCFPVDAALSLAPDDIILLCASDDVSSATCDYVWGSNSYTDFSATCAADNSAFALGTNDIIELAQEEAGAVLDNVDYNSSWHSSGVSAALDPSSMDATSNDSSSNWCAGTATFTSGSTTHYGSPGATNSACP